MDPNDVSVQLYLSLNQFTSLINQFSNLHRDSTTYVSSDGNNVGDGNVKGNGSEHGSSSVMSTGSHGSSSHNRSDMNHEANKKLTNFLRVHLVSTLRTFSGNILDSGHFLVSVPMDASTGRISRSDEVVYLDCLFHWWQSLLNLLTNNNKNQKINLHLSSELISVILEVISRIINIGSNCILRDSNIKETNEDHEGESLRKMKSIFQHHLLMTIHFITNNLLSIKKYKKLEESYKSAKSLKSSKSDTTTTNSSRDNERNLNSHMDTVSEVSSVSMATDKTVVSSAFSLSSSKVSSTKRVSSDRMKWYRKLEKSLLRWTGKIVAYSLYHLDITEPSGFSESKNNEDCFDLDDKNDGVYKFNFDLLLFNHMFPNKVVKKEGTYYFNKEVSTSGEDNEENQLNNNNNNNTDNTSNYDKSSTKTPLPALQILLSYLNNSSHFMIFYYHYLFINSYHLKLDDFKKFKGFNILESYISHKIDTDLMMIMKNNQNSGFTDDSINVTKGTNDILSKDNIEKDNEFITNEQFFQTTYLFKLFNTLFELPCIKDHGRKYAFLIKWNENIVLDIVQKIPAHNILLSNYIYQHFLVFLCNKLQFYCFENLQSINWSLWILGLSNMWKTLNCEIQNISISAMFNIWWFLPDPYKKQIVEKIDENWQILFEDQKFHSVLILFSKFLVYFDISLKYPQISRHLQALQRTNIICFKNFPENFQNDLGKDALVIPGFKKFLLFSSPSNKFLKKPLQYPLDLLDELAVKMMSNPVNGNKLQKSLPPTPPKTPSESPSSNSLNTMFAFLNFTKNASSSSSSSLSSLPKESRIPTGGESQSFKNSSNVSQVPSSQITRKKLIPPPELKIYQLSVLCSLDSPTNIFQNVSTINKTSLALGQVHPIQAVKNANLKWGVTTTATSKSAQQQHIINKNLDKKPLPDIQFKLQKDPGKPSIKSDMSRSSDIEDERIDKYEKFEDIGLFSPSDTLLDATIKNIKSSQSLSFGMVNEFHSTHLYLDRSLLKDHSLEGESAASDADQVEIKTNIFNRTKIEHNRKCIMVLNQTVFECRSIMKTKKNGPIFILYNTLQRKSPAVTQILNQQRSN